VYIFSHTLISFFSPLFRRWEARGSEGALEMRKWLEDDKQAAKKAFDKAVKQVC
jgi:predicted DNA-binding WGR domain protein